MSRVVLRSSTQGPQTGTPELGFWSQPRSLVVTFSQTIVSRLFRTARVELIWVHLAHLAGRTSCCKALHSTRTPLHFSHVPC